MIIKYLINRPNAVIAIFLSILVVGVYGWIKIPVSLLPDVDPPEITIEVRDNGTSAEVLEQTALSLIRQSVIGSYGLKDVKSVATQSFGRVHLSYEFGTNMNLATIEINEKIDRIMSRLPVKMDRPIVKQKKPSDIPVIRIHLTSEVQSIVKLSQLVKFEITKRFEQLPGVAQIEISGTVQKSIRLIPKMEKLIAAGIDLNEISSLINQSNVPIGQILVREGNYEYLVQIENLIRDEKSLKNLIITTEQGLQVPLGELFDISEYHINPLNSHFYNQLQGVVLAIYHKPEADLFKLQKEILSVISHLRTDFPSIEFHHSQDQALLLGDNIDQLYITSGLAILFAFIVFFISGKSTRLPFILGTVVPSSILISIGTLWIMGFTLNIITLSGFILGIGLLVDNVIILIEEIGQHRKVGRSVIEACVTSASTIFPALLSSTLTTVCVFIPLMALDGIASELFKEQAIALVIILGVSLVLSFVLIPTFYNLWIKKNINDRSWIDRIKALSHSKFPILTAIILIFIIGFGGYALINLKSEELPPYSSDDYQVKIRWNEPLSLIESQRRLRAITNNLKAEVLIANLGVNGITQNEISFFDEANLYIKIKKGQLLEANQQYIGEQCAKLFPKATLSFSKAPNPFEMVFYTNTPPAVTRIRKNNETSFSNSDIAKLNTIAINGVIKTQFTETNMIKFRKDRIHNSNIPYTELLSHLKNLTDENIITSIKHTDQSIPVSINKKNLTYFFKKDSSYFDLASFYMIKDTVEVRSITADLSGPYISFVTDNLEKAEEMGKKVTEEFEWVYDLDGELLNRAESLRNLLWAVLLGITLLYLILVAQFESFLQPLIIFSIAPFAILGGFTGLVIFGGTINIMSIIGTVVMVGIIVNDSILKIDAINRNIKRGMNKSDSIKKAKDERLKPILMTSLSTVLALFPVLFSSGIAADLQKPLAIVVIFGLVVGTWSSIVLLPRIYLLLKTN